jgi:hypothetical protein
VNQYSFIEIRLTRAIVSDRWKLGYNVHDDQGDLYDLQNDPEELYNLWGKPQYQEIQDFLMQELDNFYSGTLAGQDGMSNGLTNMDNNYPQPTCEGCKNPEYAEYNHLADVDVPALCENPARQTADTAGCMEAAHPNYDPFATVPGDCDVVEVEKMPGEDVTRNLRFFIKHMGPVLVFEGSGFSHAQVFDLQGNIIRTLSRQPGNVMAWDRRDKNGNLVRKGVYAIRFLGHGKREAVKVLLQ